MIMIDRNSLQAVGCINETHIFQLLSAIASEGPICFDPKKININMNRLCLVDNALCMFRLDLGETVSNNSQMNGVD